MIICGISLPVVPIIFSCCVLVPAILRVDKQDLFKFVLGFLMFKTSCSHHDLHDQDHDYVSAVDLPFVRLEDLQTRRQLGAVYDHAGLCSVCMMEFEGKDVVSRLSRCGHVFHSSCIERWLHRNHLPAPFVDLPCLAWTSFPKANGGNWIWNRRSKGFVWS